MDEPMRFFVRSGSTEEIYEIEASREGPNLRISCTCRAGEIGAHCRHRTSLLNGDITRLVEDRSGDMASLDKMFRGSALEREMAVLQALENEAEELKRKIAGAKKAVSRRMRGH